MRFEINGGRKVERPEFALIVRARDDLRPRDDASCAPNAGDLREKRRELHVAWNHVAQTIERFFEDVGIAHPRVRIE